MSVPTVQRWVDLGHLKAWKTVGGHRRIDAESAENFIRVQMQQRGGEAAAPAEAVAPFSVLVVDDNPDDSDLLCALVEIAVPGARIVVAANGFDALIEVGKAMPDLIVTDITMPHMDGVADDPPPVHAGRRAAAGHRGGVQPHGGARRQAGRTARRRHAAVQAGGAGDASWRPSTRRWTAVELNGAAGAVLPVSAQRASESTSLASAEACAGFCR